MERVRGEDVDGVNGGVRQKRLIIPSGAFDPHFGRELLGRSVRGAGNGNDFDVAQAADAFNVYPAHEAGPDNRGGHFFHMITLS